MRSSSFAVAAVIAVSSSGCALRPLYRDLVQSAPADAKSATFMLLDATTQAPLPGVKLELSEGKNRVQQTTAADGTFSLPLEKKYRDENPFLVVAIPAGVSGVVVQLVTPAAPTPAPAAPPAEAVPPPAAAATPPPAADTPPSPATPPAPATP